MFVNYYHRGKYKFISEEIDLSHKMSINFVFFNAIHMDIEKTINYIPLYRIFIL